ncbi:hypothetical protein GTD75_004764, partial [Salmonella enterica subsp. enterica serovar Uganda]|nr:hypothetical protein [Salmonella enterica subsp. enterica serovar Uganda]
THRILSFVDILFLLINKLMLISSFVYAYSLKKRDVMTLMIAFLDAVN